MNENQTTIQLAGREATLTADNRAKFRFQFVDGKIWEVFNPAKTYMAGITLLWSCLDDEARKQYPKPIDLCDVVEDGNEQIFTPMLNNCAEAGWFPTAEQLRAMIAKANADLDEAASAVAPEPVE